MKTSFLSARRRNLHARSSKGRKESRRLCCSRACLQRPDDSLSLSPHKKELKAWCSGVGNKAAGQGILKATPGISVPSEQRQKRVLESSAPPPIFIILERDCILARMPPNVPIILVTSTSIRPAPRAIRRRRDAVYACYKIVSKFC